LLSFAAPLWLLGLLALPAIRRLHRGGRHRRALPVAYLGLWQGVAARTSAAAERQPPDPAWRRRALFAALISLALATPQWPAARSRATLWVDAAPSMFVREAGGTRLALALAQARSEIAARGVEEVEYRLLGDPWHALDAAALAALPAALRDPGRWSQPPPAALLRREREQWLLTDGVHATARTWPEGNRPDVVIQVASVLRNVGIDRLAARRNADDAQRMDVLVRLVNGGNRAETRELIVEADGREAARTSRTLDAEASVSLVLTLPAAKRLRASLQPHDALPEDDALALDLAPLARRRVAVDPSCAPALRAAVATHPGLTESSADAAEAMLECSGSAAAAARPTLRVLGAGAMNSQGASALRSGVAQWSAALASSERPAVDTMRLRLAGRLDAQPGDDVLLALGERPAVVRRAGPVARLDCALDFAEGSGGASPDTPLLVDWLFARLLGAQLLDAIAVAGNGVGASRVVPSAAAPAASAAMAAAPAVAVRALSRPLLLAALAVLLWEIASLALQWWRLRETKPEAAA